MFLIHVLNQENEVVIPQSTDNYYKYFIGQGNNSLMVRNLMKQRWWWYLGNNSNNNNNNETKNCDFDDCHFIWTQWRKIKVVQQLKSLK